MRFLTVRLADLREPAVLQSRQAARAIRPNPQISKIVVHERFIEFQFSIFHFAMSIVFATFYILNNFFASS